MDESWQAYVHPSIAAAINTDVVPGMLMAVTQGTERPTYLALGTDAVGTRVAEHTIFPVASITKLATALTVLRLVDTGLIALDERLAQYLPEATAAHDRVTIRRLLTHTAGLPAEPQVIPLENGASWEHTVQSCLQTDLVRTPGTYVGYSSAGYGLLAIVVERVAGQPFDRVVHEQVFAPLGVEAYWGNEPSNRRAIIVPHTGAPEEWWNAPGTFPVPWGGLRTTAEGILRLLHAFRGMPRNFLKAETAMEATRNQVGELGGGVVGAWEWTSCPWGLGPELQGGKVPHWISTTASWDSYGHLGSSGCVVWYDPRTDVAWAILATRTIDSGWALTVMPTLTDALLSACR